MASISSTPAQSSEGSPPREHHRAPRSDRVVCTSCRQSKVKCVGSTLASCSRCTRLGLDCRRDTNFKRVCKSRKIAELEKQVERLTTAFNGATGHASSIPGLMTGHVPHMNKSVSPQYASATTTTPNEDPQFVAQSSTELNPPKFPSALPASAVPEGGFGPAIFSVFNTTETSSPPWLEVREPAKIPRTIHSVFLSTNEIDELFHLFFDQYHPFLPFLDATKSPDDYYTAGPLLFWAIIAVASRRFDIMLFHALSEWVPKLVWSTISSPPYSIASAQAIILVTCWPFPSPTMRNDTLTTLSAVAVSVCMQLGLHRPLNATDFQKTKVPVDEKECRSRTAIWAAAIIVAQGVEATMGILPATPFDSTIDLACNTSTIYTLPDDLRIKLMVQRYCHKVTKAVCNYSSAQDLRVQAGSAHFTLPWQNDLDMLEIELNTIERENSQTITVHDRVHISAARFYSTSMAFFDPSSTTPRKLGVLRAYNHAATLLLTMMEADALNNFLQYMTNYHTIMYLIAVFTIVKVLRSSYSADVDAAAGQKLCNRATAKIARCSVANNDSAAKSSKIITQVWHSEHVDVLSRPPMLHIKSRFFGSLLYDFIWMWRLEFGHTVDPNANTENVPEIDQDILMTQGFFEDASMVDLNFLNDPNWMDSLVSPMT